MSENFNSTYSYDNNNVFAKLIRGDLPASKLYDDDIMIIIKDIHPITELHFLAIPKGEYVNYDHFLKIAKTNTVIHFFKQISNFTNQMNIEDNCQILCNSGFHQSVRHFHMHIMSGLVLRKDDFTATN